MSSSFCTCVYLPRVCRVMLPLLLAILVSHFQSTIASSIDSTFTPSSPVHPPHSILHHITDYQIIHIPSLHYPSHRKVLRTLAAAANFNSTSSSSSNSSSSPPTYVPLPTPTSHPLIHSFHFRAYNHSVPLRLIPSLHLFTSANYSYTRVTFQHGKRVFELDETTTRDEMDSCYYRLGEDTDAIEEMGTRGTGEEEQNGERMRVKFGAVSSCYGGYAGLIASSAGNFAIEPAHRHMSTLALSNAIDHSISSSHYSVHIVFPLSEMKNVLGGSCGTPQVPEHQHFHTLTARASQVPEMQRQEFSVMYGTDWADHLYSSIPSPSPASQQHSSEFDQMWGPTNHAFRTLSSSNQNYVEFLVANDHARYLALNEAPEVSTNSIVNVVNTLYVNTAAFIPPIQVVLIGQLTFRDGDPYNISTGNPTNDASCTNIGANEVCSNTLLGLWTNFRSNPANTVPYQNHDTGHLYSGFSFNSPVLGLAYIPGMCIYSQASGVEQMNSQTTAAIDAFNGAISAHEMGHNFNMQHDEGTPATCPVSGDIMNAEISTTPTQFSQCSINYLNSYATSGGLTCTANVPTLRWGQPICGNGYIEVGEQCDCGRTNCASINPCCNGLTCQFVAGAVCNADSPCCTNCTVTSANANLVCRPAVNSCDLPETCDGSSEQCPSDQGYPAGTVCQDPPYGSGNCYQRQCMNYAQQCHDQGDGSDQANNIAPPRNWGVCPNPTSQSACQTLTCATDGASECSSFLFGSSSSSFIPVYDGTPCSSDGTALCLTGQCVDANSLNQQINWVATAWVDWPECGNGDCVDPQQRNVSCQLLATGQVYPDIYCLASAKPISTQQFLPGSNIVVWTYTITQLSLIIGGIGAAVGYLLIAGCCYHFITRTDDDQPPLDGDGKAKSRRSHRSDPNYKGSHAPGFSDAYRNQKKVYDNRPSAAALEAQQALGVKQPVQRDRAGSIAGGSGEQGHMIEGEVHHVRYASVHHVKSLSS